jgi:hypothetical protein
LYGAVGAAREARMRKARIYTFLLGNILRRQINKWKDSIKIERDYVMRVGGWWIWFRIVSNVFRVQWWNFVLAGLKDWGLHMA